jgi:hypothetical protein
VPPSRNLLVVTGAKLAAIGEEQPAGQFLPAARWTENGWRIAVALHVAKHGAAASPHQLEEETAAAALKARDWFCQEQLRLLYSGRRDATHRENKSQIAKA